MPRLAAFLLILAAGAAAGCASWTAADGTRHTLVLGFGLVSTKEAPDGKATALRAQTLGLAVRPGGLALGYQSLQQTTIAPDWQGIVQVSATPGQPLTVEGHGPPNPPARPAAVATLNLVREGDR
ncbi:MAG: hypothetical protein FJ128_05820 [Deltaproteobacteria bacterium]|nr:hypothetical protein [Deltaproteobacteria bacterium]